MAEMLQCRVPAATGGESPLRWLCGRFRYHDERQWLWHIEAQRVRCNGALATAADRVRGGDVITFVPSAREPASDDVPVLFADEDLVVVSESLRRPACAVEMSVVGPWFRRTQACLLATGVRIAALHRAAHHAGSARRWTPATRGSAALRDITAAVARSAAAPLA